MNPKKKLKKRNRKRDSRRKQKESIADKIDAKSQTKMGVENLYNVKKKENSGQKIYFKQKLEFNKLFLNELKAVADYELRFSNEDYKSSYQKSIIDVRQLALKYASTRVSSVTGLQEVTWGQAVFLPILDVVNSRDFLNSRGVENTEAKIPQILASLEWSLPALVTTLYYNPYPRVSGVDTSDSSLEIPDREVELLIDSEYGGKVSFSFDSGLYLNAYYYNSLNPAPVYLLDVSNANNPAIVEHKNRTSLFGMDLSFAGNSYVVFMDMAYKQSIAFADSASTDFQTTSVFETVFGSNYFLGANATIGLDLRIDSYQETVDFYENETQFTWFVPSLSFSTQRKNFTISLWGVKGVDNEDSSFSSKVEYNFLRSSQINFTVSKNFVENGTPIQVLGSSQRVLLGYDYIL